MLGGFLLGRMRPRFPRLAQSRLAAEHGKPRGHLWKVLVVCDLELSGAEPDMTNPNRLGKNNEKGMKG